MKTLDTLRLSGLSYPHRGRNSRAESAISESVRRIDRHRAVFLFARHSLNKFYGGLLLGSRKACRYLTNGYCTPDSTPAPLVQ